MEEEKAIYSEKTKIKNSDEFRIIKIHDIKAKDAFSATRSAGNLFDFATRSLFLMLNEGNSRLKDKCVAVATDKEGSGDYVVTDQLFQKHDVIKPTPSKRNKIVHESKRALGLLINRTMGGIEFDRLSKAIDLHNTSLQIGNYQNSFLCIWTALEVLCDGSKNVAEPLSTVLKLNYLSRRVSFLRQLLAKSKCMNPELASGDRFLLTDDTSLLKLLFDPTRDAEKKELYSKIASSPFLINQLWRVSELPGKGNLLAEVERYGARVSWHIERMYRTRNSIVHAGELPSHLKSLGEHLHAYLDVLFDELFWHFDQGGYRRVEEILTAIKIEYRLYHDYLRDLPSNYASIDVGFLLRSHSRLSEKEGA